MTYQGLIFQESGVAGWSTVYYINAASLAAAMTLLQDVNSHLLGCQAEVVFTTGLRVSDVEIRGDGLVADPTAINGSLVMAGTTLAPINLAVRIQLHTSDFRHRVNHYIHGVRQSDISTDATGHTITTPVYRGLLAVTSFISTLEADTVNWQKRTLPPVTAPLTSGDVKTDMSIRRVGRPFDLFRGRRRTV